RRVDVAELAGDDREGRIPPQGSKRFAAGQRSQGDGRSEGIEVMSAEGTERADRDKVIGVDETVDAGKVAAFEGEGEQPLHGRLIAARIDANFFQYLGKARHLRRRTHGDRVGEALADRPNFANDLGT